MTDETSKSLIRRGFDRRFVSRYFVGDGIDIGAGGDSLAQYAELFPRMRSCRSWDIADGDAMLMQSIADNSFDFVHSSHCLEHLVDPDISLQNWIRITKPSGYLVIIVPDEDLYEQGIFPSQFNSDHKWTFTIHKSDSWSPRSVNLFDLISKFPDVKPLKLELLDSTYRYNLGRYDQTTLLTGESAIELVLQKT